MVANRWQNKGIDTEKPYFMRVKRVTVSTCMVYRNG